MNFSQHLCGKIKSQPFRNTQVKTVLIFIPFKFPMPVFTRSPQRPVRIDVFPFSPHSFYCCYWNIKIIDSSVSCIRCRQNKISSSIPDTHILNHFPCMGLNASFPFLCFSFITCGAIQKLFNATFCFWRNSPTRARVASCSSFLDHSQLHTTVGRTVLDKGSARRRDLYLTTHNAYNRQASMHPAGFESAIPASELPYTLALG